VQARFDMSSSPMNERGHPGTLDEKCECDQNGLLRLIGGTKALAPSLLLGFSPAE
jgi:hypothetical protein